jgi:hypothetical protein
MTLLTGGLDKGIRRQADVHECVKSTSEKKGRGNSGIIL